MDEKEKSELVTFILNVFSVGESETLRVKENSEDFLEELQEVLDRWSSLPSSHEITTSKLAYPKEYIAAPILEQLEILSDLFRLRITEARKLSVNLPELPVGAEAWFAFPKASAITNTYFSRYNLTPQEEYTEVAKLVLSKLEKERRFSKDFRSRVFGQKLLRHRRTTAALDVICQRQPGDIILVPAQYGLAYKGMSDEQARRSLLKNEFGLGLLEVGLMNLLSPNRHLRTTELGSSCPGDYFLVKDRYNPLKKAVPTFFSTGGILRLETRDERDAKGGYGPVTGFIPQEWI